MAEQLVFGKGDGSFRAAGGYAGVRQLVDRFYDIMDTHPEAAVIRAMHPADLTQSRDKLTRFLCGWLGGPKLYQQTYGPISIPAAHSHLAIGSAQRDAWLQCMQLALDGEDWTPEFKGYLLQQLTRPAEFVRNRE